MGNKFTDYQVIRRYIPNGNWHEISDLCIQFGLNFDQIEGIKREFRAYRYLMKGKPKGSFAISDMLDDINGIDIFGFNPKNGLTHTFQVGNHGKISVKTDYIIHVTSIKIYIEKVV